MKDRLLRAFALLPFIDKDFLDHQKAVEQAASASAERLERENRQLEAELKPWIVSEVHDRFTAADRADREDHV